MDLERSTTTAKQICLIRLKNALIQVAEKAVGDNAVCVDVTKLPEENFNKAFLASLRDGEEVVVKIPNPNAGMRGYVTASEVATLRYVRERLGLPVPGVLSYCSRVDRSKLGADRSKLGAEYIVMEKVRGFGLGRVWEGLTGRVKLAIVEQIASITSKVARASFPAYGSLYLREDVKGDESIRIDDTFAVGPITGRPWFDDRRRELKLIKVLGQAQSTP